MLVWGRSEPASIFYMPAKLALLTSLILPSGFAAHTPGPEGFSLYGSVVTLLELTEKRGTLLYIREIESAYLISSIQLINISLSIKHF